MPEVGLELHSSPCEHWAPAETYGIRPEPTHIRPDPKPKVWTLSTRRFSRFKAFRPTTAPRDEGMRSFLVLTALFNSKNFCGIKSRERRDATRDSDARAA